MNPLKAILNLVVERISLQQLEYEMERDDLPDDYNCFEIGYCGHPASPYAHIQLEQSTKWIIYNFREEEHPLIYDTINNKNKQLVWLYFVYRPNKNASRIDITDDDQKAYAFAPTYGDVSTDFQRHTISVVVFFS